jgi:hypothetical protein
LWQRFDPIKPLCPVTRTDRIITLFKGYQSRFPIMPFRRKLLILPEVHYVPVVGCFYSGMTETVLERRHSTCYLKRYSGRCSDFQLILSEIGDALFCRIVMTVSDALTGIFRQIYPAIDAVWRYSIAQTVCLDLSRFCQTAC